MKKIKLVKLTVSSFINTLDDAESATIVGGTSSSIGIMTPIYQTPKLPQPAVPKPVPAPWHETIDDTDVNHGASHSA